MKRISPTLVLLLGATAVIAQSPARSVWDGVYSADQAKRGQAVSGEECARCHSESLTGGEGAPALVGEAFVDRWKGLSLSDLFEKIRTTMPTDSPGRLGRQEYSDVLAFILRSNKFPAGTKDLAKDADALSQIKIEPKK